MKEEKQMCQIYDCRNQKKKKNLYQIESDKTHEWSLLF